MDLHPPWLALAIALALAKLLGEVFHRLRLPPVLGEIGAGILLGNLGHLISAPSLRGLTGIGHSPEIGLLAEIGAVMLLFQVGLESDARELIRAGMAATRVAVVGVIVPFVLGYLVVGWLRPDATGLVKAFVGAVLCATSVGITARVLKDLGRLDTAEARVILGAAVIDDVLGLVVLAVVLGMAGQAGPDPFTIGKLILLSTLFLGGGFVIGRLIAERLLRWTARGKVAGRSLVAALLLCFGAAEGAHAVGLAPIVGAFAAGLILDPLYERASVAAGEEEIRSRVEALGGFLIPLFFVHMGASCDLSLLGPKTLLLAGALTAAAVVGKQATALVAGAGVDRWAIGFGMIPRGEVGLIVAYQGSVARVDGRPLVDEATFAAVVMMVLLSTVLTPPLLAWRMKRLPGSAPPPT
ncbi:MAG: cation:proton antiporter [Myxococcales bacterium]|nr:cation:proton antiporter [Myxococcales bacterium]